MRPETEKLTNNALDVLDKEFTAVGKTRVRSWHAWWAIGIAVGIVAGVLFIASRS